MDRPIALRINGRDVVVRSDPGAMLLDVLRNELGLCGTRFGCGEGQCGACQVLVDGRVRTACDTSVAAVAGQSVTTVEGLGSAAAPHPLQAAFIAEQAKQCGYCISGILVSAAALLARNPAPSDAEIRHALDGNLCRCGAHNRIVRAVQRAAEDMRRRPA